MKQFVPWFSSVSFGQRRGIWKFFRPVGVPLLTLTGYGEAALIGVPEWWISFGMSAEMRKNRTLENLIWKRLDTFTAS
jgi:hypothetical protein